MSIAYYGIAAFKVPLILNVVRFTNESLTSRNPWLVQLGFRFVEAVPWAWVGIEDPI